MDSAFAGMTGRSGLHITVTRLSSVTPGKAGGQAAQAAMDSRLCGNDEGRRPPHRRHPRPPSSPPRKRGSRRRRGMDSRFRGNDGKERPPHTVTRRPQSSPPPPNRHPRESGGPGGAAAWIPASAGMTGRSGLLIPSPAVPDCHPRPNRHPRESGGPSGASAWIPACAGMTGRSGAPRIGGTGGTPSPAVGTYDAH
jgi:hypothetical protein